MQVNSKIVPSLTASTGPAKTQASPEVAKTAPKAKPLPTPPQKPVQAPIGSQQEADAVLQHLDNTPTATVQNEASKLEKTPKFKKAEDTIIGEVKHDATAKARA